MFSEKIKCWSSIFLKRTFLFLAYDSSFYLWWDSSTTFKSDKLLNAACRDMKKSERISSTQTALFSAFPELPRLPLHWRPLQDRNLTFPRQVLTLTHFFLSPFCKKNPINLPGGLIHDPFVGETLFSSVPPSNSLFSVSDPWRAF